MRKLLRKPIDDLAGCLGHLANTRRPFVAMCVVLVALIVTWFIYVPVHELLHVLACVAAGGSVSRLEIAPQYGGKLLEHWLPFVVSGGDYAGRLSGFDTKGSDLIYLATDLGPFVLSIVIGVPLLRTCAQRWRPVRFGVGIVVGLAPFYNLTGDYFEMGSIIVTRMVTLLRGGSLAFAGIRSDDVFKLVATLCTDPGGLGLNHPGAVAVGALLVAVSLFVGVGLAVATYALGDLAARIVTWRPGVAAGGQPGSQQ